MAPGEAAEDRTLDVVGSVRANGSPWSPLGVATAASILALYALVFYRNAWVGDDAYITFRSVEQWVAGNGPRWNPHDRVQAFTHPLWFGLLAVTRLASSYLFRNALVLSLALTCALLLLLPRALGTRRDPAGYAKWGLAACVLISSKAWVDYAWSGLENPLTFLLLVLFVERAIRASGADDGSRAVDRDLLWSSLWGALLILSRPDNALFCLPALGFLAWRRRRKGPRSRAVLAIALGLSPLAVWELFSLVYYGVLVANTAYAKLSTAIPASELRLQGLYYLANAFRHDPLTPTLLLVGALVALARSGPERWLGIGVLLHLGYVVQIGGDFMAGRFLTGGFLIGALALLRLELSRRALAVGFGLVLMLQLAVPAMPLWTPPDLQPQWDFRAAENHGIADEKGYYYDRNSWRLRWRQPLPPYLPRFGVVEWDIIGFFGYSMPLETRVVDSYGLSDPLLARLPATNDWRIGHFRREIPAGYLDSLRADDNRIEDPAIHDLYEKIRVVTQGPIFSWRRARAIWDLHWR